MKHNESFYALKYTVQMQRINKIGETREEKKNTHAEQTLLIASLVMQSRSDNITNNKMYITSKQ